tara:strand:+ start:68 stop:214 length:147 start_codon:yes stop_codon:yes gene_type:complete
VFLEKDITKADDENRKKVDKREIIKISIYQKLQLLSIYHTLSFFTFYI